MFKAVGIHVLQGRRTNGTCTAALHDRWFAVPAERRQFTEWL
jgi:hypothetical protein